MTLLLVFGVTLFSFFITPSRKETDHEIQPVPVNTAPCSEEIRQLLNQKDLLQRMVRISTA